MQPGLPALSVRHGAQGSHLSYVIDSLGDNSYPINIGVRRIIFEEQLFDMENPQQQPKRIMSHHYILFLTCTLHKINEGLRQQITDNPQQQYPPEIMHASFVPATSGAGHHYHGRQLHGR
jgi:hypothetical protein